MSESYLEQHFQGDFTKWLKSNDIADYSYGYELKRSVGGTVAFSKFEDQQLPALLASKTPEGLHHKISDMSINLKPMDGFVLKNAPGAFVGVCFHANDKERRSFWFIEIDFVMQLKKYQKSITLKNCQKLGFEIRL